MPYTKLNVHQRRTIADASRLIFDAGFREKGRLLDDLVERSSVSSPSSTAGKPTRNVNK